MILEKRPANFLYVIYLLICTKVVFIFSLHNWWNHFFDDAVCGLVNGILNFFINTWIHDYTSHVLSKRGVTQYEGHCYIIQHSHDSDPAINPGWFQAETRMTLWFVTTRSLLLKNDVRTSVCQGHRCLERDVSSGGLARSWQYFHCDFVELVSNFQINNYLEEPQNLFPIFKIKVKTLHISKMDKTQLWALYNNDHSLIITLLPR